MKTKYSSLWLAFLAIALSLNVVDAQRTDPKTEKEIIIIEKTVDEKGNEIRRNITRKKGSELSEEELKKLMEEGNLPGYDSKGNDWNFDLGNWEEFSERFGDIFQGQSKPTIGITLNFEDDKPSVADVVSGSGAEDADIRIGDELVSINRLPISDFDDVQEAMEGKKVGDLVEVVVFRDGKELSKQVELRSNFFGLGLGSLKDMGSLFQDENFGDIRLYIDSLFGGENFGQGLFRNEPFTEDEEKTTIPYREDRPSLGVFVEDTKDGVLVTDVIRDSAAARAGIEAGDLIKRIDDEVITSFRELAMLLNKKDKGDRVTIEVSRKNKIRPFQVELN